MAQPPLEKIGPYAAAYGITKDNRASSQWITFSTILKQLETQHIPLKKPGSHQKKAPWVSYRPKAVKLLKKKHRMYNKYTKAEAIRRIRKQPVRHKLKYVEPKEVLKRNWQNR